MTETKGVAVGEYVSIVRDGAMATVAFDRGDGLNALSVQAMEELRDAARALAAKTDCSAIVLTGGAAFSAGADLSDPALSARAEMSLLDQREAVKLGPDLCQAWADLEPITICAVERFCVGGGLALAVSCDHRVAARDSHFRLPEVPLGLNMSWRSVPRLVALVGPSRAKELIILGEKLSAERASEWGLVDRLAEPGCTLDVARELANAYCAMPPLAARMVKQAVDASAQPLAHATSFMDRDQFLLSRLSDDHTAAVAKFRDRSGATQRGTCEGTEG